MNSSRLGIVIDHVRNMATVLEVFHAHGLDQPPFLGESKISTLKLAGPKTRPKITPVATGMCPLERIHQTPRLSETSQQESVILQILEESSRVIFLRCIPQQLQVLSSIAAERILRCMGKAERLKW